LDWTLRQEQFVEARDRASGGQGGKGPFSLERNLEAKPDLHEVKGGNWGCRSALARLLSLGARWTQSSRPASKAQWVSWFLVGTLSDRRKLEIRESRSSNIEVCIPS